MLPPSPRKSSWTVGSDEVRVGAGEFVFLGVDLESSGRCIIAVGLSVVTMDRRVLHASTFSWYRGGHSKIEFCESVRRFFGRHPTVLPALEAASVEAGVNDEAAMVRRAYDFIRRWQGRARKERFHVRIASDNPAFDVGELNALFRKHGHRRQLPQNLSTGVYECVYDTKSMCSMLAMTLPATASARHRSLVAQRGSRKMVEHLFDAPPVVDDATGDEVMHSHVPHEDAACHAGMLAILFGMSLGNVWQEDGVKAEGRESREEVASC